jgi:3-hydroxyisobutyrate dehydrogenase-like beta-hydroxyacid dehydrogenase
MTDQPRIAFIGLGNMGSGIAGNLIRAGFPVTLYNRTPQKLAPLLAMGGRGAGSIAEACAGADILITMLADDAAEESVCLGGDGAIAHLREQALHISHTTIGAAMARRLAAAHETAGQAYLSAPVFGRPEAAAAASLVVLTGGRAELVERARPLLEAIGQKIFSMGERPEAANIAKLGGNMLIATVIESLGEVLALAGKAGIDRAAYVDMLTSTLFAAPVYKTYGGLIVEEKFEPAGFAAPLGLKDVKLALAAADELRVPLPIGSLLRDRFLALLAQGGERLDWSAAGSLAARDAGLETIFKGKALR